MSFTPAGSRPGGGTNYYAGCDVGRHARAGSTRYARPGRGWSGQHWWSVPRSWSCRSQLSVRVSMSVVTADRPFIPCDVHGSDMPGDRSRGRYGHAPWRSTQFADLRWLSASYDQDRGRGRHRRRSPGSGEHGWPIDGPTEPGEDLCRIDIHYRTHVRVMPRHSDTRWLNVLNDSHVTQVFSGIGGGHGQTEFRKWPHLR
ncbi:Uncharacterised protein [Mycobacteroides abscessus subsp. massiliense]|nr:Uncharacterised protein [Mycobacteroides abscessus subsp. massiliense]